jgi:hypothetical protein
MRSTVVNGSVSSGLYTTPTVATGKTLTLTSVAGTRGPVTNPIALTLMRVE